MLNLWSIPTIHVLIYQPNLKYKLAHKLQFYDIKCMKKSNNSNKKHKHDKTNITIKTTLDKELTKSNSISFLVYMLLLMHHPISYL